MPSAHQYMQTLHSLPGAPGGNWSRSDCSSFAPAGRISLPVLSLIGPAKTSNRPNVPASILASVSLTFWTSASGRSATPLVDGLAVHEPEQAHRLGVGVEVLVAGLVGLGLDLLGDARVLGAPDPVRRGQAALDLARVGVVVGDGPLALLLGDVGDGRRVGAGEHDLRAGVEQRRRARPAP